MEIESVNTAPSDLSQEEDVIKKWGGTLFTVNIFLASPAFYAAYFKKKRSFSSLPAPIAPFAMFNLEPESDVAEEAPAGSLEEKAKVAEIFKIVASLKIPEMTFSSLWGAAKNSLSLASDGIRAKQLGDEIDHIHPFAFLMAAPKDHVKTIFTSGSQFKMDRVLGGIRKGMEREMAKNQLSRYISHFAQAMGKEADPIRRLIQMRDWMGLVNYLFDTRGG